MIRWELMSLGLKIKTTCQVDSLGFRARKFMSVLTQKFMNFGSATTFPNPNG